MRDGPSRGHEPVHPYAVASLVLEQLGLDNSVFAAGQAVTRRFAVGHNLSEGTLKVARAWKGTRGNTPGGGLAAWRPRCPTNRAGPGSTSAAVTWRGGCGSRRWSCTAPRSVTPSASPGSCVTWTVWAPSERDFAVYENEFMTLIIGTDGDTMTVECRIKPEIRAASETELPPDIPPVGLGLLPGNGDEYIVTGGGLVGQRGFLTRDAGGGR